MEKVLRFPDGLFTNLISASVEDNTIIWQALIKEKRKRDECVRVLGTTGTLNRTLL